ncbi:MAG: partition protein [Peptococcaceae bacterium]|nr:partition protein [Peptococcaceae bacterium]
MVRESLTKLLGINSNHIEEKNDQVREISISSIKANPFQPRKIFDPVQLEDLAKSIKEYGVIQPIIVRRVDNHYELVAGERRLRASQSIGKKTIPAIIRDLSDREIAEMALIENLQREDLNFFEEAEGYHRLIQDFGLTQEEIAKRVGKSQSTIANKLRLLKLPEMVRKNISTEVITERHARALLKLPDAATQLAALKEIYEKELNVRETDALVEKILEDKNIANTNTERGQKIVRIFKDMRIYLNTIRTAVTTIQEAGLAAKMTEKNHEDYIEVVIQIPKIKN